MKTVLASTLVFLGIFLLFVQTGECINCYVCNSHNDSKCALAEPPKEMKKDCSQDHSDGSKYTMCRKIVQNIDFEVNGNPPDIRVIRGCGWDDSSYLNKCYQRSGFGGRQEVCSCTTGDYCNGAGLQDVPYVAAFLIGALLLARFHL